MSYNYSPADSASVVLEMKNVLIGVVASCLLAPGALAGDREGARKAYAEASAYHQDLLDTPSQERTRDQYNRAIFLYRLVVDRDPSFGGSDDALFYVATLYEEMFHRFGYDSLLKKAISYYEFVATDYPSTPHREAALSRARRLRDPASASPEPVPAAPAPSGDAATLATVSEIRYWSSQDYTRVVIQLDREVDFDRNVLHEPDRIYFDLKGAQLEPNLETNYDVNGVFLQKIRVGENHPGFVRVVLDFEEIQHYGVFALYEPFRIVIDIRGNEPSASAERIKTAEAVISFDKEATTREVLTERPALPEPDTTAETRSLTRTLGLKVGRVALDPGHGGHDTGTIGPSGLREKDLVLDVAKRLKHLLEERLGTEVILTRDTDKFVPLEERTALANQAGADLFISIHANSSRRTAVSGTETFVLNFASDPDAQEVASRENASSQRNIRELEDLLKKIALGDYREESRNLGGLVQRQLAVGLSGARPSWVDRGVKKAPFIVLIHANMPSILTEIGFLSNPDDETFFQQNDSRDRVAESIYSGIEDYFRALGSVPAYEKISSESRP